MAAIVLVIISGGAWVLGGRFGGWIAAIGALSSLVSLLVRLVEGRQPDWRPTMTKHPNRVWPVALSDPQAMVPTAPTRSSVHALLAAALVMAAVIVASALIFAGRGGDDSNQVDDGTTTAPLMAVGDDSTVAPGGDDDSVPSTPTVPATVDLMDRVSDAEDGHFCVAIFIASDRSFRGEAIRGAGCLWEPTGQPGRLRIALAKEFATVTMTFGLCDGAPSGDVPVAIAVQPGQTSEVVVSPSSPAVDAAVATSGAEQLELSMVVPDDTCFVLASAVGARAE